MKLLFYKKEGHWHPGIAGEEDLVYIFPSEPAVAPDDLCNWFTEEKKQLLEKQKSKAAIVPAASLRIGPCVPRPGKIICIGLNYRRHAEEAGMEIPKMPVAFTKYNNTLTDYGSSIVLGKIGEQFDYEAELGVVIGKRCKNVAAASGLDHVFGYCVANDLSCRDLQFRTPQWLLGKSLDGFLPLGKWVVTADEITNPQRLQITCSLNGELRQNQSTRDMIFSVAEIVAFLSDYMTLDPGDLIITGTPEGVIMGRKEKKWLRPGDLVHTEIEKLGFTENRLV